MVSFMVFLDKVSMFCHDFNTLQNNNKIYNFIRVFLTQKLMFKFNLFY